MLCYVKDTHLSLCLFLLSYLKCRILREKYKNFLMKFFKSCTSWSSMKSDEVYELFGDMSFSYFYEKITLKDKRYGGQMLRKINRDILSISHFIWSANFEFLRTGRFKESNGTRLIVFIIVLFKISNQSISCLKQTNEIFNPWVQVFQGVSRFNYRFQTDLHYVQRN